MLGGHGDSREVELMLECLMRDGNNIAPYEKDQICLELQLPAG